MFGFFEKPVSEKKTPDNVVEGKFGVGEEENKGPDKREIYMTELPLDTECTVIYRKDDKEKEHTGIVRMHGDEFVTLTDMVNHLDLEREIPWDSIVEVQHSGEEEQQAA